MPKDPGVPRALRRNAPNPPAPSAEPTTSEDPMEPVPPPAHSQYPALQTFVPRLNRYMQARLDRTPGEVISSCSSAYNVRPFISTVRPHNTLSFPLQITSYTDAVSALGPTGKSPLLVITIYKCPCPHACKWIVSFDRASSFKNMSDVPTDRHLRRNLCS